LVPEGSSNTAILDGIISGCFTLATFVSGKLNSLSIIEVESNPSSVLDESLKLNKIHFILCIIFDTSAGVPRGFIIRVSELAEDILNSKLDIIYIID
jgi:hypothetical protein